MSRYGNNVCRYGDKVCSVGAVTASLHNFTQAHEQPWHKAMGRAGGECIHPYIHMDDLHKTG